MASSRHVPCPNRGRADRGALYSRVALRAGINHRLTTPTPDYTGAEAFGVFTSQFLTPTASSFMSCCLVSTDMLESHLKPHPGRALEQAHVPNHLAWPASALAPMPPSEIGDQPLPRPHGLAEASDLFFASSRVGQFPPCRSVSCELMNA